MENKKIDNKVVLDTKVTTWNINIDHIFLKRPNESGWVMVGLDPQIIGQVSG